MKKFEITIKNDLGCGPYDHVIARCQWDAGPVYYFIDHSKAPVYFNEPTRDLVAKALRFMAENEFVNSVNIMTFVSINIARNDFSV